MKKLTKKQKTHLILIEDLEDLLINNEITQDQFTDACKDVNNFINE